MENMSNIRAIESLDEMTTIIKALLNDIAEDFISVGFYLKMTEQDELYKQAGYRNICVPRQAASWTSTQNTVSEDSHRRSMTNGEAMEAVSSRRCWDFRKKSRKLYQQKPRSKTFGRQKGLSGKQKHIMMIRWSCATSHRKNSRKQTGWWN